MTVIVGIPYHSGLIMASDLLQTDESGRRSETKKLYHNDKLIIGAIGVASDSTFKALEKRVPHWHSINYVLKSGFRRFIASTHDIYLNMNFLLGVNNTGEFELWLYKRNVRYNLSDMSQRVSYEMTFAGYRGRGLVLRPGLVALPYEEWISCNDVDEHKAIELAMSNVRRFTQAAPESYSGLDILHMTTNGVTRVGYDPINK
jgi:hypothetical protein